jgi:hypothetical protein|tara:strand:+ start:993 stop:3587 length:2595 start_codon:yes stop_codon:yes gene_type:complete
MKTPQEYLNKDYNITPCGTKDPETGEFNPKRPKLPKWQDPKNKATIKDFNGKDNIGLITDLVMDLDVDNPKVKEFINLGYLKACNAIYGRKSNPKSHYVFKGQTEYKKYSLPKEFDNFCKNFPHGNTLLELRSGPGHQSIVPGSVIEKEPVEWNVFKGISPYEGDIQEDTALIAFMTAMSILYPNKGDRDNFCYAIACILARETEMTDSVIDDIVYDIACKSHDEDFTQRRGKGSHARKQIEVGGHIKGFTTLQGILGLDSMRPLYQLFYWVGVEPPDEKLIELRKKFYYFKDTGEMWDPKEDISYKEKHFNNVNLFDFPGTKKGKKGRLEKDNLAFAKLLKDPEFQEQKLQGRAMLPDSSFPIAEIEPGDHPLLPPGRYFNLYEGRPLEPEEGDVSEIIQHFKKVFGEDNWRHLEQYLAYCIANPGVKTRWIPLVVSVEGVGKGLLMRMMSKLMGYKYVNENVSFNDITEKHSVIVVGSLFICLNEVVLDKQYSTKRTISSKIKPFITDDFLNINDKGIRPYKYLNNCNAIVFSNDKDCLHVDTSSRRYLVIHCKTTAKEVEKMSDRGDFDPLWKMLDKNPEYLLDYFLNKVVIEDEDVYQKRAPKTPELLEMIEDSRHDVVQELEGALREGAPPFDEDTFRGFISLEILMNFMRHKWNTPYPPRKLVKEWLKENCIEWKPGEKARQIVMRNGQRPRVYLLAGGAKGELLKCLTEGQLGQMMSYKNPGIYWENLELDYFMKESVTKDKNGETWNWKDPKLNQMKTVWFGKDDQTKRALYYLKFMDSGVVQLIIKVKQQLIQEENRLKKKFTKSTLSEVWNKYYDALDYVKFNEEYKPIEAKAHKLIDKIIKEEKAKKEEKEPY